MFKNLGGQVLGMLGVSAGIAGLGALAKQTIDLGGHVEDMARNLRMGKSEFQTLAYSAKLAGMEESRLVMTMNNLNLRTIEACDGNKSYQESFKRLGISLQEFATVILGSSTPLTLTISERLNVSPSAIYTYGRSELLP